MTEVRILHNPRCSKSRATLALLEERGIQPTIIDYLQSPPSIEDLRAMLDLLGVGPRAILRTNEDEFAALGLGDATLSDAHLIDAMHRHPRLIQRPIVIANGKAAIGRPPESVLDIL